MHHIIETRLIQNVGFEEHLSRFVTIFFWYASTQLARHIHQDLCLECLPFFPVWFLVFGFWFVMPPHS